MKKVYVDIEVVKTMKYEIEIDEKSDAYKEFGIGSITYDTKYGDAFQWNKDGCKGKILYLVDSVIHETKLLEEEDCEL